MKQAADFVLLIASVDRKGIVAAVAKSIVSQDCNIVVGVGKMSCWGAQWGLKVASDHLS